MRPLGCRRKLLLLLLLPLLLMPDGVHFSAHARSACRRAALGPTRLPHDAALHFQQQDTATSMMY